jgi:hypothetical protein
MDLDAAIKKTTEILQEQWRQPPNSADLGYKFYLGLVLVDKYFSSLPPTEAELENTILLAQDDHGAFQALRFLIASGLAPESRALAQWNIQVMAGTFREPRSARGPSPITNLWRDHLLCGQIKALKAAGFSAYRNAATDDESSACDIVAKATHLSCDGRGMTYDAVEAIWKRHAQLHRPELVAKAMLQPLFDALLAPLTEK